MNWQPSHEAFVKCYDLLREEQYRANALVLDTIQENFKAMEFHDFDAMLKMEGI
jgi:hypothetical protein